MHAGYLILVLAYLSIHSNLYSQRKNSNSKNLVYVDKQGVLRWSSNNTEASFFGVNYTTPFAYAYRAHKALNADLEKAIQQDVYHMARLGLDAFRVHVWDTEISDTAGNLLENDHLRLFDFLLAELKKRNIKTVITPIAFWGNGYPERDEATPGFSRKYGKGRATTNDTAIAAQENYLKQFFKHVNPYTKLTYVDDPDVIAIEINNEPSHSGPKAGVTNYINRLAAAVRSVGCTKPIYYNISQGPFYADAVAKANIDGVSFQWYPSGLVANREVLGNFLPHVDRYTIPFDTIPEYRTKTKMVYEFDAADVLRPNMYPAMARAFRGAGFQWATQFAYDPLAIAYANTEYQTHYLNLAYTPAKAISFLIASKVFHRVPRLKQYGTYPADTLFDVFRVSYRSSLSEMNSEEEFYYSNNTNSTPVNISKLQHVAGVGSSPVIQFNGTGAYFLDRIEEGVWRLEIMPDAIHIRDPFERAAPSKEVTAIQWGENSMQINIPELGNNFQVKGLNTGNQFATAVSDARLQIGPGTYLVTKSGKRFSKFDSKIGSLGLNEFVSPPISSPSIYLRHEPFTEVTAGRPFTISATVSGIDTGRVSVQISRLGGGFGQSRLIRMERTAAYEFSTEIPANLVSPGMLNYRIILQKGNEYVVFPDNVRANPFAWDNYSTKTYSTFVAATNNMLELFNASTDRDVRTYPTFRRGFQTGYTVGAGALQLAFRISANELAGNQIMGMQYFFGNKVKGRMIELDSMSKLVINARTTEKDPVKAKITLTNKDAIAFSTLITLTNSFQQIEVPLNTLVADSSLLLPRPYPEFLPLKFAASTSAGKFKLSDAEKIEITIGADISPDERKKPHSLELSSIWLQK